MSFLFSGSKFFLLPQSIMSFLHLLLFTLQPLKLHCLPDGLHPTPPMGWSSWNTFFSYNSEEKMIAQVKKEYDQCIAMAIGHIITGHRIGQLAIGLIVNHQNAKFIKSGEFNEMPCSLDKYRVFSENFQRLLCNYLCG